MRINALRGLTEAQCAAALGLYKKLGFAVTFQMDYYSQPI
jgi:ribosomal protein S18 acetylase RimI-like enzyme